MTRSKSSPSGQGGASVGWGAAAVFTVSAAVIALELALMRCLSVASWHHFSYLVISTALMGFGASGALLALVGRRMEKHFAAWAWALTLMFVLSVTLCFRCAQALPLDVRYVLYSGAQVAWMSLYHALLFIPFFVAATVIGLSLMHFSERLHLIYAANLAGSGAGGALALGLMFLVPPQKLLYAVCALGMVGAALWLMGAAPRQRKAGVALWAACAALLLAEGNLWPLRIKVNPYKMLSVLRRWEEQSDATHLMTRYGPRAQLDVFDSPRLHQTLFAGLTATEGPPAQLMILADGHPAGTVFKIGSAAEAAILDHTPMSVPYRLQHAQRVLLLGESGGGNVWLALRFGAAHVTVVQRNPQILNLMRGPLAVRNGRVLLRPQVTAIRSDPRLFLERTNERYDLIQLATAEEMTAGSGGLLSLNEDFLLTREGLALSLERLSERGILTVTRGIQAPPRDGIKIFASLAEALESLGIGEPGNHLVLLRNYLASTVLASRSPFEESSCRKLDAICQRMMLDLEWRPYKARREGEQTSKVQGPPGKPYSYFHHAARMILSGGREAFFEGWVYNVRPASDDSPYFYNFFRWRSLPRFVESYGRHWLQRLELGYVVLVFCLAEVFVVGGLLILAPLLWLRARSAPVRRRLPTAAYFLCLGLAFMMIEMVFILEFTRFLGDPIYAAAGMVTAFLVFSGTGSAASRRLCASPRRAIGIAALGIAALMFVYARGLSAAFTGLARWSTGARFCLSIVLTAPVAFLMGWPFPNGLTLVKRGAAPLLPWAWGVNGFASVAASPLAVLLAISFGYSRVMLFAGGLYVVASLIALALPGTNRSSER